MDWVGERPSCPPQDDHFYDKTMFELTWDLSINLIGNIKYETEFFELSICSYKQSLNSVIEAILFRRL